MDEQKDGWMGFRWMDVWMEGWMDKKDGWLLGGWTCGWKDDGWMG